MRNKFRQIFQFIIFLLITCGTIHRVSAQPAEELKTYQEKYPGEPVIYIANEEHVEVTLKKGELQIISTTHEDLLLMQENGSIYSEGSVYYSGWTPLLEMEAKTLIPDGSKYRTVRVEDFKTNDVMDGSIFHDDSKEKVFYYPNASKGSRLVLDYTLQIKEPRFMTPFMFGSYCPIENSIYTITCPAGMELEVKYYNTTAEKLNYTKSESKGTITHTWKLNAAPKLESEPSAPSIRHYAPHLVAYIKSYQLEGKTEKVIGGLDDLYKYYYNFVDDLNDDKSPELKEIVDSLVTGVSTEEEKVKKIFYWVQDNIKYVAFEAGLEGFVPRHASVVCSKRYGDCKDMANIITEMLTMAKIDAHLTWIGTRDIPYSYLDVPTPLSDNHMIAAYKTATGFMFLDATASYIPFGMPTPFIQGKEALIEIDKDNYELVKVPVVEPEKNLLEENMRLSIEGDKVIGKSTSHYTGYVDMLFSELFKNVKPEYKEETMTQIYEIGNNTFTLDTMYEENLYERDKEFYIHYAFNIRNYAKFNSDKIFINLTLDKDLSTDKMKDDRVIPMEEEYKQTIRRTVTLDIPAGYEAEYIPENTSFEHDMFNYKIEYSTNGTQIIMKAETVVNFLMLEKDHFKEWNSMIKKLNTAYNEVVILKKK